MPRMVIRSREGRFEVDGVDYGDYLEGYFMDPPHEYTAYETLFDNDGSPVARLGYRRFMITLGPNEGQEEVLLVVFQNSRSHAHLAAMECDVAISVILTRQSIGHHVWYFPKFKTLNLTTEES